MNIGLKFCNPERELSGINRTILESVSHILRIDGKNHYYALEENYLKLPIESTIPDYVNEVKTKKKVCMENIFGQSQVDLVHSYYNPIHDINICCPKIMTFHDIIPVVHPEWNPAGERGFKNEFKKSAQKADAIVACSEWTKSDIINYYNVPEEKIHVVYWGIGFGLRGVGHNDDHGIVKEKYGLQGGYILSVCTLEPRKNLRGLIKGFIMYKQRHRGSGLKLVLTGKAGWDYGFQEYVRELGEYKNDITLTGYVPDEELVSLYAGATAFAYVSFYEGFGLPILEATSAGKAVICSDQTCMPEVGGDAVQYCNPYEAESIGMAIEKIAEDAAYRTSLEKRAIGQSEKFSYEKTAEQTLQVYGMFC